MIFNISCPSAVLAHVGCCWITMNLQLSQGWIESIGIDNCHGNKTIYDQYFGTLISSRTHRPD